MLTDIETYSTSVHCLGKWWWKHYDRGIEMTKYCQEILLFNEVLLLGSPET